MTLNVLMMSPGYPAEMPYFTRGLARVGARVIGLGDQAKEALPEIARSHLAHHVHVHSLWDEGSVVREVQRFSRQVPTTASSACGSRACCSPRASARRWACRA